MFFLFLTTKISRRICCCCCFFNRGPANNSSWSDGCRVTWARSPYPFVWAYVWNMHACLSWFVVLSGMQMPTFHARPVSDLSEGHLKIKIKFRLLELLRRRLHNHHKVVESKSLLLPTGRCTQIMAKWFSPDSWDGCTLNVGYALEQTYTIVFTTTTTTTKN